MTQTREVVKAGWLQERVVLNKLLRKKSVDRPALWYTLCVHDDRVPFLEAYNSEQECMKHRPVVVQDLLYCNHLCPCIDERSMTIGLENRVITLVAFTKAERQDWLDLLKFKLEQLQLLEANGANLYSSLPTPPVNQSDIPLPDPRRLSVFYIPSQASPLIDLQTPPSTSAPLPPNQTSSVQSTEPTTYSTVTSHPINTVSNESDPPPSDPQHGIPPPIPPRSPLVVEVRPNPRNGKISMDAVIPPPLNAAYFSFQHSPPNNGPELMTYDVLPSTSPPIASASARTPNYDPVPDEPNPKIPAHSARRHSPDYSHNNNTNYGRIMPVGHQNSNEYYGRIGSSFSNCEEIHHDLSGYSVVEKNPRPVPLEQLSVSFPDNGDIFSSIDRISINDDCPFDNPATLPPSPSQAPLPPSPSQAPLPPTPPPLPPRNSLQKSLIETEVDSLQAQIMSKIEICVEVPLHDVAGRMAFVQFDNSVWIAGWMQDVHRRLSAALHVGDRVVSVNGSPVSNVQQTNIIINAAVPGKSVKLGINRMPYAQIFLMTREKDDECIGIELQHNKNTIENVIAGSPASRAGISSASKSTECPWVVSCINGRFVGILSTNNSACDRLNGKGKQMSIVLQPKWFIKNLTNQLKLIKNYKVYHFG